MLNIPCFLHPLSPYLAIAALAFQGTSVAADQSPTSHASRAKSPVELNLSLTSPVIAQRGDIVLTEAELRGFMAGIPPERRAGFLQDPERLTKAIRQNLLEKKLAQSYLDAQPGGVSNLRGELLNRIWAYLAKKGRNELSREGLLNDYEQRAREMYLANKEEYNTKPTVSFSHIMLAESKRLDAQRDLAEDILRRLRRGEAFQELVLEYSDDPSADRNLGRVDQVSPGRLDKNFAEGIAKIDVGSYGIVESGYGLHVVHVRERNPARPAPFEDVRTGLIRQAREEHRQKLISDFVQSFNEKELKLPPGAVERFIEQYGVEW